MNNTEVDCYKVSLISEKAKDLETGEICTVCYKALMGRLKGDKPAIHARREAVEKAPKPRATQRANRAAEDEPESAYEPAMPSIGQAKDDGREATKELLEDELQVVPSRFDKRKASQAARKMRGGGCPHSFKSYRDGKAVCGPPPDGFNGDLAKLDNPNGCGKVLTESEY
jgi:hypothetical protein